MPPIMRVLTGLVLTLPGYLMSAGGFAISMIAAVGVSLEPRWLWPQGLLVITGSALTGVVGFLMVTTADLLTGARHYRMPRQRIAVVVGYEIAVLALYTLTAGAVFGTMVALFRPQVPWGWLVLCLSSISGVVATLRSKKRNGSAWKQKNGGPFPGESGDQPD